MKKRVVHKMVAVFEVEFDPEVMYGGEEISGFKSPFTAVKWLYKQEGLGIFDKPLILKEVKPRRRA